MSKLLQRLRDAARSGVYRVGGAQSIEEATRASALDVVAIDAGTNLFDAMARALDFPDWFGRNWDALEDSLSDLAWRKGEGHVLLLRSYPAGDELGVLIDVLRAAAEYWAGRGKPFFAVFIDPHKRLALADLYREA
ncbi:MAG TPA: barstar family protein [Burkholderiales bacterium]|nr:barstar family protein [Burkholderiales bacterium]